MRRLFQNIASNYSVTLVDAVLLIAVTPIVVQSLGVAHYSVWIIVRTLGFYLGFLDLGLPDAQVRQHAILKQSGGTLALRALHGTTLTLYLLAGAAGMLLAIAGAFTPAGSLFGVTSDTVVLFPFLLVAIGVDNVFAMLSRGIDGIYQGEERYDAVNMLHIGVAIAKAAVTCLVLFMGFGLVALILVQILFGLVACVVKLAFIPKLLPPLERPRLTFDRTSWQSIKSYSLWNSLNEFMSEGTARLDKLLIPIFLSSVLVGPYSLVITIAAVVFMVGEPVSSTYLPMFSRLSQSGQGGATRALLLRGTRLVIVITLPATVVLLFFGNAVLDLWIGPEYSDVAASVLWFSVGNFFIATCLWTPLNVLMAAGRIREIFWISVGEVLLVLALILVLVPVYQLSGLALAGFIGNLVIGLAFFIPMACRQAGESTAHFVFSTLILPVLAVLPLCIAGLLLLRYLDLSRWLDAIGGSLVTGVVCLVAVAVVAIPRRERLRYFITVRQILGNAG